jgi:hypothetical protein
MEQSVDVAGAPSQLVQRDYVVHHITELDELRYYTGSIGELLRVTFARVPLDNAALRKHRRPDVCDPYIRMAADTTGRSLPQRTRRSAVAAHLQTAAFARLCGSLHAGLALPWSATDEERGSGTECLLSLANVEAQQTAVAAAPACRNPQSNGH